MAKKYRYGTTRQGYQITNCLTDEYGRTTIVAKRANDYMVAKGYNYRGDGRYGFDYINEVASNEKRITKT